MRELKWMADAKAKLAWSQTSALLSLTYNINRDPKKSRVLEPRDFDPYAPPKKKTYLPLASIAPAIVRAING